jgi:hypothetical protein
MNESKTEMQKERQGREKKGKVKKYNSLRKEGRKDKRRLEGGKKDGRMCGCMCERMNEGGKEFRQKNVEWKKYRKKGRKVGGFF